MVPGERAPAGVIPVTAPLGWPGAVAGRTGVRRYRTVLYWRPLVPGLNRLTETSVAGGKAVAAR
jgi:hypothetical protein